MDSKPSLIPESLNDFGAAFPTQSARAKRDADGIRRLVPVAGGAVENKTGLTDP
jgi:hypothetical protein